MTLTKTSLMLVATLALTACGGAGSQGGGRLDAPVRSFANGPIHDACLQSDRRASSRALCGCVQASANTILIRNEQARAVAFFRDPHLAQVTRQSDRSGDERFWIRYKEFVDIAERSCA